MNGEMSPARLPEGVRYQCPACGTALVGTTARVVMLYDGSRGLTLECGHTLTAEIIRDMWGIEVV